MSRNRWDGDWPPRTTPIRPADGIRAQSKRGAFASGWWAKRWIAVLEAFQLGTRLTRGRSYARKGQVTQIAIEPGGVRAQVQGSRPKPYDVTIRLRQLEAAEWRAFGSAVADDVRLCAALLAGEMPEDIERAFAAAGTSLFPTSAKEMKTACSCPDWSNPCKHVAAVFYLIGEEFDRDPFLLFVLRCRERDDVRDLFGPQTVVDVPRVAERPSQARAESAHAADAGSLTGGVLARYRGRAEDLRHADRSDVDGRAGRSQTRGQVPVLARRHRARRRNRPGLQRCGGVRVELVGRSHPDDQEMTLDATCRAAHEQKASTSANRLNR